MLKIRHLGLMMCCALLTSPHVKAAPDATAMHHALNVCADSVELRASPDPGAGWILAQPFVRDASFGIDQALMRWVREDQLMAMLTMVTYQTVDDPGLWNCELLAAPGTGGGGAPLSQWAESAIAARGYVDFSDAMYWRGNGQGKRALAQCREDGSHLLVVLKFGDPEAEFAGNRDWGAQFSRVKGFGWKVESPCPELE